MTLVSFRASLLAVTIALLAGCSQPAPPPPTPEKAAASAPSPAVLQRQDPRAVIVAFGDSLSAGYGLEPGQSYPDELQKLIDAKGLQYRVVNQGLSGDTTTGGLARIDSCLDMKPRIVLLELGGNDGLRGIGVAAIRENLNTVIRRLKDAGATVVLIGITLPRNYGDEYIKGFERNYVELAREHGLAFVPFLLDGIWTPKGGKPGMMQEDGIHPTAQGTPVMAATVFKAIEKLLVP